MKTSFRNLRTFGAFYRDNAPDGFAVMVNSTDMPKMAEWVETNYQRFKTESIEKQREFLNGPVYEQLKLAKRLAERVNSGQSLSHDENALLFVYGVTNILILEREGLLQSDDHNGMLYVYEPNR